MAQPSPRPTRLSYITGLRGIAALFVVLWHIITIPTGGPLPGNFVEATPLYKCLWFAMIGPQMVWLFLLISGFALYWSENARRQRGHTATPLRTYLHRRVWRIAPVYYVAIAFSMVLLFVGRPLYLPPTEVATGSVPITWGGFVSHLVFMQNLRPSWQPQINTSLWSLAYEVQIYFLFPLLVLRWKKSALYVGAAFIVVNHWLMAIFVRPEFVVSDFFIVGVWLAVWLSRPHRQVDPAILNGIAFVFLVIPTLMLPLPIDLMKAEPFWVIGLTALILRLHQAPAGKRRIVDSSPLQRLGEISYSLYAMHFTLILALWWAVGRLPWAFTYRLLLLFALALPLSWLLARVTFRAVERPTLLKSRAPTGRASHVNQPKLSSPTSPGSGVE